MEEKKIDARCETCSFMEEDPETGDLYCSVNMDQDELWAFLNDSHARCPYYHYQDDYTLAKRQ